jgi:hypothetical protein
MMLKKLKLTYLKLFSQKTAKTLNVVNTNTKKFENMAVDDVNVFNEEKNVKTKLFKKFKKIEFLDFIIK